tara:strand:- start:187 stop:387 length:201 start_codon:yes stop_codon:yes gene_type:complete
MSNNIKLENLFDELTFTDIFETFDEEYLIKVASSNPEQLNRMCIFLTLDNQLRREKSVDMPLEKMN